MKNQLFLIILITFAFSCKKVDLKQQNSAPQAEQTEPPALAVLPDSPNVWIPEDLGGFVTSHTSGRVGLFHAYQTISYTTLTSYMAAQYGGKVAPGTRVKTNNYECLVVNATDEDTYDTAFHNPIIRSGAKDYITVGGIQPVPLSVNVYKQGDLFIGRKKDEFYYTNSDKRIGAPDGPKHPGFNYISWQHGDTYRVTAIIPEEDGHYVIAVSLDYNKPNPKTALLPIHVTGLTSIVDLSAIDSNAANPATNYKATLGKGRLKGVNISWSGNGYAYCIERFNGSTWDMILRWYDGRSFFDATGNKFSKYRIITRGQGRLKDAWTPEFKPTR